MSKNFVAKGDVVQYTAGADIISGQPVLMGDILGVALKDIANGDSGSVSIDGVWELAKLSTDAFSIGQILFWDAGNSRLTSTAGSNKPVGLAFEAALNPSSTCKIKLVPLTKDTDT